MRSQVNSSIRLINIGTCFEADLPYLLPHSATINKTLMLVLAFGNLSYLEACTVLGERLSSSKQLWEDIATIELRDTKGGYENLAGIHKVAVAITPNPHVRLDDVKELDDFLQGFDDDFNFSISLYSPEAIEETEYEEVLSTLLAVVRDAGFRKANLVRPRKGTEVLTREIASRKIIDFIVLKIGEKYWLGATFYVPDSQQFTMRSNERPVVSSQISISSRLAKLLLNLSGVKKGGTVLDPFCGSGTILSEALMAGMNCIGVDRDKNRIDNSKQNLEWLAKTRKISKQSYSLKIGDSTRLEAVMGGVQVDAIVTEPILLPKIAATPSLDKARKLIRNSSRLYSESLYSMAAVVRKGGRIVIVAPSLRTEEGRDVSVLLEDVGAAGLAPFQPTSEPFEYPARMAHENTRWVRRLVYVFERT
jgi:tRNA G10  N-methylase Trm11